jgi:hypothetical protein
MAKLVMYQNIIMFTTTGKDTELSQTTPLVHNPTEIGILTWRWLDKETNDGWSKSELMARTAIDGTGLKRTSPLLGRRG